MRRLKGRSNLNRKKSFIQKLIVVALTMIIVGSAVVSVTSASDNWTFSDKEIGQWLKDKWKDSDIPGMSVIIVDQNGVLYNQNFGYADSGQTEAVDSQTVFELGSMSKAFTGLSILQLEKDGKLKLSDPVSLYLPWFSVNFEGSQPEITIGQLLHHTSGIPFTSIGLFSEDNGGNMLEQTVRKLVGIELDEKPGLQFLYATINYDVLGLIVERITGEPFDSYLQKKVIDPLGLTHTFAGYGKLQANVPAQGYKMGYLQARTYDAPMFSGNMPAGYVLSTTDDMARWMMLQMGTVQGDANQSALIEQSHIPDRTVSPNGDGSSYGAGWAIFQKGGGEWSHGGTNPTFSSYIVMRPEEKIGVAILTNINSEHTYQIGQGVMDLMLGKELQEFPQDFYKQIDRIAMCMLLFAVLVGMGLIYSYGMVIVDIIRGKRIFSGIGRSVFISMALSILSVSVCLAALYFLPYLLFWKLPWSFVKVWASPAVMLAVQVFAVLILAYAIHSIIQKLFPKPREKPMLSIVIMSLLSGFGNAFIVFMINQSFQQGDKFQLSLVLYFVMGIVFYVYAQKVVRSKMVLYANQILYEKRMEIVDGILSSRHSKLEGIDTGKVNAALISDTERISNSVNVAISGITSLITLIFCFIYLAFINVQGLLLTASIIIVAGTIFYVASAKVNRIWEFTRDVQNVFFKFTEDLIRGSKELSLHSRKRQEFRDDMDSNSKLYKDKRSQGDLMFANVYVIGELMFTVVIGVVAFVFPFIFKEMGISELRNYVFVFLYMTGPINGVLNAIPQILGIRISWKRVKILLEELYGGTDGKVVVSSDDSPSQNELTAELILEGITYHYDGGEGDRFKLGPVNYTFRTGEVVFITGGNGSGKSTLSKIITGLYSPDEGTLSIDGQELEACQLGEYFSTVFSDFYLFDRMYGLDLVGREEEVEQYLHLLQLQDKVEIHNGTFSTTKLSTGQRKRLALLTCYLDNRPFYLFDEWAADQDPEYREYFYTHLLKQMKLQGKGVIAITHDERYFHLADKVLKLEFGQMVQLEQYVF